LNTNASGEEAKKYKMGANPINNPQPKQRIESILECNSEVCKIHHKNSGIMRSKYERVSILKPRKTPDEMTDQPDAFLECLARVIYATKRHNADKEKGCTAGKQANTRVVEANNTTATIPAAHCRVSYQTSSYKRVPSRAVSSAASSLAECHDTVVHFIQ
jgi:hypothetical protein